MSTYYRLLKDPKWQKKRLEVLERDNFSCVSCGDKENTLHVHHCYYRKSALPWDYPTSSLVTLCEGCHIFETENFYIEKNALTDALSMFGFLARDFNDLACCVQDFYISKNPQRLERIFEILKEGIAK